MTEQRTIENRGARPKIVNTDQPVRPQECSAPSNHSESLCGAHVKPVSEHNGIHMTNDTGKKNSCSCDEEVWVNNDSDKQLRHEMLQCNEHCNILNGENFPPDLLNQVNDCGANTNYKVHLDCDYDIPLSREPSQYDIPGTCSHGVTDDVDISKHCQNFDCKHCNIHMVEYENHHGTEPSQCHIPDMCSHGIIHDDDISLVDCRPCNSQAENSHNGQVLYYQQVIGKCVNCQHLQQDEPDICTYPSNAVTSDKTDTNFKRNSKVKTKDKDVRRTRMENTVVPLSSSEAREYDDDEDDDDDDDDIGEECDLSDVLYRLSQQCNNIQDRNKSKLSLNSRNKFNISSYSIRPTGNRSGMYTRTQPEGPSDNFSNFTPNHNYQISQLQHCEDGYFNSCEDNKNFIHFHSELGEYSLDSMRNFTDTHFEDKQDSTCSSSSEETTQFCDILSSLHYAVPFLSDRLKSSLFHRFRCHSEPSHQVSAEPEDEQEIVCKKECCLDDDVPVSDERPDQPNCHGNSGNIGNGPSSTGDTDNRDVDSNDLLDVDVEESISKIMEDVRKIDVMDGALSERHNEDSSDESAAPDGFSSSSSDSCHADDEFECDCGFCEDQQFCNHGDDTALQWHYSSDLGGIEEEDENGEDNSLTGNNLESNPSGNSDIVEERETIQRWLTDNEEEDLEDNVYRIGLAELPSLDAQQLELMFQNVITHIQNFNLDFLADQAPPPASSSVIQNLPQRTISQLELGDTPPCPICLSAFVTMETVTILPCDHIYHCTCIQLWLTKSGTCPVCRHVL